MVYRDSAYTLNTNKLVELARIKKHEKKWDKKYGGGRFLKRFKHSI